MTIIVQVFIFIVILKVTTVVVRTITELIIKVEIAVIKTGFNTNFLLVTILFIKIKVLD